MSARFGYISMLLFLLLAAGTAHYLTRVSDRERVPARAPLSEFPQDLDGWRQVDVQTLGAGALRELGADDFISRTYATGDGSSVFLSIAWYASQRHRRTFHSPQNCIPAAGWTMNNHRLHTVDLDSSGQSRKNLINEYLVEKNGEQMIALYWYHGRGRAIASEYWGRWYTIEDAIRLGRTDGALVRVIAPIGKGEGAENAARKAALDFTRRILPILPQYVPD